LNLTHDPDTMSQPQAGPPMSPPDSEGLRLALRHLTRFEYDGPVQDSFNDVRLCPVSDPLQSCESFELRLDPVVPVHSYHDFYLNRVDHFDLHHPHDYLEVEARSMVQTRPDPRGPVTEAYPPALLDDPSLEENYFDFLADSHFVTLDPEVWREAIDLLPGGVTDLWQDSLSLARHLFRSFTYVPSATHAGTRVPEVLRTRRGVCQDYAHVMLALCRTQGIPARYVSGYFFDGDRPPGQPEASHAWVEVFLPGYGWKGIDPTHDRMADTRYVKLAVGRDYADIRPVNGTYRGRGTRKLIVDVQVRLA
jgi:transglutaminase-like putative cysteine protease